MRRPVLQPEAAPSAELEDRRPSEGGRPALPGVPQARVLCINPAKEARLAARREGETPSLQRPVRGEARRLVQPNGTPRAG